MSTISAQSMPPRVSRLSLLGRLLAMLKLYRRVHQHRRASRALATLNDHMLKDMGISRSEIHGAVRGDIGNRRDEM
jgi:uncharacterized protein YjiS (DUF1127 family)